MKLKLLYILPLIAVLLYGCLGSPKKNINPAPVPDGVYSGQFTLLRLHPNYHVDTLRANITLTMSASAGTYTVTGDTSTVHAGSHGAFAANTDASILSFNDATYSASAAITKAHLAGTYQYAISGTSFKMQSYGQTDTLAFTYEYDLTKQIN